MTPEEALEIFKEFVPPDGKRDAFDYKLEALTALRNALPQWKPIETHPRTNEPFWAICAGYSPAMVVFDGELFWDYELITEGCERFDPHAFGLTLNQWPLTHWMPGEALPTPPTEGEG